MALNLLEQLPNNPRNLDWPRIRNACSKVVGFTFERSGVTLERYNMALYLLEHLPNNPRTLDWPRIQNACSKVVVPSSPTQDPRPSTPVSR